MWKDFTFLPPDHGTQQHKQAMKMLHQVLTANDTDERCRNHIRNNHEDRATVKATGTACHREASGYVTRAALQFAELPWGLYILF